MSRLTWDSTGERFYETGVDRGVLYIDDDPGIAWMGLSSIVENPSGGIPQPFYLDGVKYLNVPAPEEFEATLSAFTYPEEFAQCEGTAQVRSGLFVAQQTRKPFGLSYRTKVGNDLAGSDYAYKLHLVYNALAAPAQRTYNTLSDSIDPLDFNWSITTSPRNVSGYSPTAHIVIDTRYANADMISAIEDIIYGTDFNSARIPTPDELAQVFDDNATFSVTDNGDGTFAVVGPVDIVQMLDLDTFQITWPTAVFIDEDSYTLSSP